MEDSLLPAIRECLGDLAECVSEHVAPIKFAGDLAKIATSIPDRILIRKINAFLEAVPSEKREEFSKKMANDTAARKKVAEYLVCYLNQMDETEKAEILAKIFCAYVDGKIQLETFRRLAASINAAFSEDLKHIAGLMPSILQAYLDNLIRAGLAEIESMPKYNGSASSRLNHLGRIFQQIMRDEPVIG